MSTEGPLYLVRPVHDPLAAIRHRFLDQVEDYVFDIALLRRSAENPDETAQALAGIGLIAHRVSGVAATLGFAPLGDVAARLDQQLTRGRLEKSLSLREYDTLISLFHVALDNALDGDAA